MRLFYTVLNENLEICWTMVVYTLSSSTLEVEARASETLWSAEQVPVQLGL